jgi:hypothetical protein
LAIKTNQEITEKKKNEADGPQAVAFSHQQETRRDANSGVHLRRNSPPSVGSTFTFVKALVGEKGVLC